MSNEIALAPTSLPNTPPLEFIAAAAAAGTTRSGSACTARRPTRMVPIVGNVPLMRDVKQALADSGLRLLDIFTFYLQPSIDLDVMTAAMAFGAELGARYAQLIGDDPDWARMTDNYRRFCEIAATFDLIAAIEAPVNSRVVNSVPLAASWSRRPIVRTRRSCLTRCSSFVRRTASPSWRTTRRSSRIRSSTTVL